MSGLSLFCMSSPTFGVARGRAFLGGARNCREAGIVRFVDCCGFVGAVLLDMAALQQSSPIVKDTLRYLRVRKWRTTTDEPLLAVF